MEIIYLIRGPGVDEYPEIGLFSIEDNVNGKIYVHRPVDREKTPSFKVPKMWCILNLGFSGGLDGK